MGKKEECIRKTIELILDSPDAKRIEEEIRKTKEKFKIYWQVKEEINLELKAINPTYEIKSLRPTREEGNYRFEMCTPFDEDDKEKIREIFSRILRKYQLPY